MFLIRGYFVQILEGVLSRRCFGEGVLVEGVLSRRCFGEGVLSEGVLGVYALG